MQLFSAEYRSSVLLPTESVSEFAANPFTLMKSGPPVCEIGILFVIVADLEVSSRWRSPASRPLTELSELCGAPW